MAKLVPARGTLLAYFPREQAVVAAPQLESEAPPVAPRRLLESRAGKEEWGEFVPLAPADGEVSVDEWRHHFRGEVRAAAAPRAAPHAPAPPAALLPLLACLWGSHGCWARGRRLGGGPRAVSRQPLEGWKHMGPLWT